MKPFLDRDQQIELMRTAKERHQAQQDRRMADPLVRQVLTRPAPGQSAYSATMRKVACC